MERSEVSAHEVRAFLVLRTQGRWMTHIELAQAAKISGRTARSYARTWLKLGLIDLAEVFPAHRVRWSEQAHRRNASYVQRLEEAARVFSPSAVTEAP